MSYGSKHISQPFSDMTFVHTYTRNLKTIHRIQTLYILNVCSTIRDVYFLLELDARYEWRVMAPNIHHSFFPISHLRVLTHITWKLQVLYGCSAYQITALLRKTFLVWFRVAREIQLESYGPRHTSVVLWCKIVCVYCQPLYTALFGAQLCMTTKLMYLMTACCTPNDDFTVNDALFYKSKVG